MKFVATVINEQSISPGVSWELEENWLKNGCSAKMP